MLLQWRTLRVLCTLPLLLRFALAATAAASSASAASSSSSSTSASASTSSSQATCASHSLSPIHIPIRNLTLSDQTLRRGIPMSIGTPAQTLAFIVNGDLNNTYLQDTATPSCNINATRAQCSNQFGGLFDEGSSATWSSANYFALDTALECCSAQSADLWGIDTIAINSSLSLPKSPLGIFRGDQDPMNTLGLGLNSTLLNALVSIGAIASNTYGLFQGWTGAQIQYQTDGSLTFGGYDAAKITGNNITLPLAPQYNCNNGLIISVTDIKMNLMNGSNPSILGQSQGSALRACIDPNYSPITLPQVIWEAFVNVTGTGDIGRSFSPFNYYGMLIPADGAYDGNLTISIYPDLDITIPNHQLVVPDIEINPEGQPYIPNATEIEVLINSLQAINANDIPRFGMPFLSSAYLMVDNDQKQFTLWASQQSQTTNLITIGPPACTTPATTSTPQPLPSVLASPLPSPTPIHSVPKGAIAGGATGGIAAVAFCIGAFFIQRRRRAQRRKEKGRQEHESRMEAIKDSVYSDNSTYLKPEMPSDRQPPLEMPLERDTGYSVAPYEMQNIEMYEMSGTPRSTR